MVASKTLASQLSSEMMSRQHRALSSPFTGMDCLLWISDHLSTTLTPCPVTEGQCHNKVCNSLTSSAKPDQSFVDVDVNTHTNRQLK